MINSEVDRRTSVLIIEDTKEHATSIIELLANDKYDCKHSPANDPQRISSYLAQHPDAQILIVDLQLDVGSDADPYNEGMHLIRERLWPCNRTAFFIVFSAFIPDRQVREIDKLEPHCAFVNKEFEDDGVQLTQDCLGKLKTMVVACRKSAPPLLTPERLDTFAIVQEIQNFSTDRPAQRRNYSAAVDRLRASADILNTLSDAVQPYVMAGRASLWLAIGVYGSCGRLEKRPNNSDVEFAVFIEDPPKEEVNEPGLSLNELAVMFWNRVKFFMERQGWKYEGKKVVDEREPNILGVDAAEEAFVLLDKYMPIISANVVANVDFSESKAHVRNRHLQILTELRPVFNGELIFKMKKNLIGKNVGYVSTIDQLLSNRYIENLITQAYMDMSPMELKGFKNKKQYIYRVAGIAALQLGLIGYALGEKNKLERDDQWNDLFDFLVLPGLEKVIRFSNYWRQSYGQNGDGARILKKVNELADHYCVALAELENLPDDEGGSTTGELTFTSDIRRLLDAVTSHFLGVSQELYIHSSCNVLKTRSSWLFGFERYQRLMDGL